MRDAVKSRTQNDHPLRLAFRIVRNVLPLPVKMAEENYTDLKMEQNPEEKRSSLGTILKVTSVELIKGLPGAILLLHSPPAGLLGMMSYNIGLNLLIEVLRNSYRERPKSPKPPGVMRAQIIPFHKPGTVH